MACSWIVWVGAMPDGTAGDRRCERPVSENMHDGSKTRPVCDFHAAWARGNGWTTAAW